MFFCQFRFRNQRSPFFLVRSLSLHCLIYKVHFPPPFLLGGILSYHTPHSMSSLFFIFFRLFLSLGVLRGCLFDSACLIYHISTPLSNTFFPFCKYFFAPSCEAQLSTYLQQLFYRLCTDLSTKQPLPRLLCSRQYRLYLSAQYRFFYGR